MHFLFFLFSFFPPFSNRPQQEAPAAGGLHLTENSQSCHSEERSDVGISGKMLHRHSGLLKNQSSPKFRREGSCERKPSGYPFASNNPPQRQNCKIMLQNLILQFGKQLDEKAQRDFFDKLLCLFPAVDSDALCPLRGVKQGKKRHVFSLLPAGRSRRARHSSEAMSSSTDSSGRKRKKPS